MQHKTSAYVLAVALLLTGVGGLVSVATSTHARVGIPVKAGLDPSQMMLNARDLPTEGLVDYSFVFN
jgi:hypothetical protein